MERTHGPPENLERGDFEGGRDRLAVRSTSASPCPPPPDPSAAVTLTWPAVCNRPSMLALLLPLLLAPSPSGAPQGPLQVDGLRPGEALSARSSFREVIDSDHRFGRVVDARTGWPVKSARVETWTEEISRSGPGGVRVGRAPTGSDGAFKVRIRENGVEAEKIRVWAPGYLTYPGTLSDLELVRLMPRPSWTRRVQVVDLQDRPIAGALITSTYSCAHDVPAFEVTTDADGVAELPTYGLQDHTGELRVRAKGYAVRKYVDWSEVPADPLHERPASIRLARQRPLAARILTSEGAPLAGTKLHIIDGDGHHVPETGPNGRFSIEATYDGDAPTIEILGPQKNIHVFSGRLPDASTRALRVGAEDWPESTAVGTLALEAELAPGERIDLELFHADGWARSTSLVGGEVRELEFPAGEVHVSAGDPWGGHGITSLDVQLGHGDVLPLTLTPPAEIELEIRTAPQVDRVVVQVDDRSVEREPRDGSVRLSVPQGRDVWVLAEGRWHDWRARIGPVQAGASIDLRGDAYRLPARRAQRIAGTERVKLSVAVAVEGSRLEAKGPGHPVVARTGPRSFEVEAPLGYAVALRHTVDGHAECWLTTTAQEQQLTLSATPLARLVIENDTGQELTLEGPGAERLDGLHPGPLNLFVVLADGRRSFLSLQLEAGETRRLRFR